MSSAAGGSLQDRTLNKVALCSAVFAGFAYVGYSYAKTAFCRKLARRHDLCECRGGTGGVRQEGVPGASPVYTCVRPPRQSYQSNLVIAPP